MILLEKSRIASSLIMPNRRHAHPDVAEPYRRWSMIGSSKQSNPHLAREVIQILTASGA